MSTHASSARLLAGGPDIGRIPARKLARQELARSMYRPSWLARVLRDIGHWISSLVSSGPSGRPSWWAIVLLSVVVLAAVAAVLYWLGPARLTRRLHSRPLGGDRTMTAAEYRDAAEALAAAGNYQAAVIERVRAMAADLEARGILLPRPARTAAELAAETAAIVPAEAAALPRAARLFDEVRYGGRAGTQAGYAEVTGLDVRLQAAASKLPAGSASGSRPSGSSPSGSSPSGSTPSGSTPSGSTPSGSSPSEVTVSEVAVPGSDVTSAPPGLPRLGPVLAGADLTRTVLTDPDGGDGHSQQASGSGRC